MDDQSQPVLNESQPAKSDLTEEQVRDLLALNNLQASQQKKTSKLPIKLIAVIVGLVVLAVVTSSIIGSAKPGTGAKSSSSSGIGLPNQSDPTSGGDVTKQINQDVRTCSNPVNGALAC